LGYFQVELQEKKCLYKEKNVQKNRKIVKNLLMYDKKNFFPHTHKKKSPKKSSPHKQKKRKKRAEITHKKQLVKEREKKPNQK